MEKTRSLVKPIKTTVTSGLIAKPYNAFVNKNRKTDCLMSENFKNYALDQIFNKRIYH